MKLCQRCDDAPRERGYRFCATCLKAVRDENRKAHPEPHDRTLSRRGTEQIGRHDAVSVETLGGTPKVEEVDPLEELEP